MTNLTRASRKLLSRSPDECFESLEALVQHCENERQSAPDFEPPPKGAHGGRGLYCGEQDLFVFLVDPAGWIEIAEQPFAPGHPHLAASLHTLGALLQSQGNYAEARKYYQESLDLVADSAIVGLGVRFAREVRIAQMLGPVLGRRQE